MSKLHFMKKKIKSNLGFEHSERREKVFFSRIKHKLPVLSMLLVILIMYFQSSQHEYVYKVVIELKTLAVNVYKQQWPKTQILAFSLQTDSRGIVSC